VHSPHLHGVVHAVKTHNKIENSTDRKK
jgi:hypothetical protein